MRQLGQLLCPELMIRSQRSLTFFNAFLDTHQELGD